MKMPVDNHVYVDFFITPSFDRWRHCSEFSHHIPITSHRGNGRRPQRPL